MTILYLAFDERGTRMGKHRRESAWWLVHTVITTVSYEPRRDDAA